MSDYISKSALLKEFDPNGEPLDPILVRSKIVHCPSVDETEILRKPFERVVERLEEEATAYEDNFGELIDCIPEHTAIEIIKEECGVSE